uniref:Uncharacterized protein n=1 Tax=Macrostomum lignano TaxID=282301 RepID=A0A1I8FFE3_9PLAT
MARTVRCQIWDLQAKIVPGGDEGILPRQPGCPPATNFASDNGLSYLETSALDTHHVEARFHQLIRAIYKTYSHRLLVDGRSGRTPVNQVQKWRATSEVRNGEQHQQVQKMEHIN